MADRYPPWDDEYDDDPLMDEEDDLMDECGFIPGEGVCMNAGTEWCDWECPFNICDPEGM
jgi:hypothetical protein